jgi:DNA/RNA endonuclease YhcR with UshA esterase domain
MATDQLIATLQGKIIGITGTIELYQGKPEIKVISTDQIKGSDSPADAVIRTCGSKSRQCP